MPELLTGPGSALRPAYRMRPRSCFTLFLSRTSTGASTTSTSGLIRCSRRRRGAKVWVLTGPRPLMRFGDPVERAPSGPSSPACARRSDRLLHEPARSSPCIEGDCVIFSSYISSARHSFSSWPALSLVTASPTSPFLRRRLLLRPYRLLQRRFRRFAVSPRTHGARTVTVVCYFAAPVALRL